MSASGPTKMSNPSSRYRSNASQGESETFIPATLSASSRRCSEHGGVERVAGGGRELVDVERKRRARRRCREEVRALRLRVELEVRRPDHRDGVGARLRRVRRERDRVRGRLRSAVSGHEHPVANGLDPERQAAAPLVDREQYGLAVRPECEHSVEPGAHEEVRVRPERRLVEPRGAVVERRRRSGDRPVQAGAHADGRPVRTRWSCTVKRLAGIVETLGCRPWARSASSEKGTSCA